MRTRRPITALPFVSPLRLGVEVMTLDELRARADPGVLSRPLRPDFHSVYLVTDGRLDIAVDFIEHATEPGSGLWVKAGQVQVLGDGRPQGHLVLFRSDTLLPGTCAADLADDPSCTPVAGLTSGSFDRQWAALEREYAEVARDPEPTVAQVEVLRHLLCAFVLTLGLPQATGDRPDGLSARFRALLERDFAVAHDVDHYARELGYSSRTLARATRTATGRSPKALISERIALEARRLVVQSDRPIATIARDLGFTDASNFSAAFTRMTGQRPSAFRETYAASGR